MKPSFVFLIIAIILLLILTDVPTKQKSISNKLYPVKVYDLIGKDTVIVDTLYLKLE